MPEKCDLYKRKDEHIKVIHKPNVAIYSMGNFGQKLVN